MRPRATRVVYDGHPYLVIDRDGSDPPAIHGPFQPGTEPALEQCSQQNLVTDERVARAVLSLRPRSPDLPTHTDTLAGRE